MIFHFSTKQPSHHIFLSHASGNTVYLSENLNMDLCHLKQWLQGNKCSLILTKTQSMLIGSRPNPKKVSHKKVSPTFVIDDSQIEIIDKTKYLGVQLDQHLSWYLHVGFVCAKISRGLGLLKYAKKLLPHEAFSHIYRGIIELHFRYCSSVIVAMIHLLMPLLKS